MDIDQIRRILDNLLENSLKYVVSRPVIIEVSVYEKDKEILIDWKDNGEGVPEEKLHLFTDYDALEQALLAHAPTEGTVAIFFELYAKPIAMRIRRALAEKEAD